MNEERELDKLQKFLENCGIRVWREVIPDQCESWPMPYRADLIFMLDGYGLIGVEGKHIRTHGQGSKLADAYLQIRDKYSNKTYFKGLTVKRWCVFFPATNSDYYDAAIDRINEFIKRFFNRIGIGIIQLNKYSSDEHSRVAIDTYTQFKIEIKKGKIEFGCRSKEDFKIK